ncbi:NAD-dependent dihydropyrimidine dehydrogenase subunit PreA [Clostridium luticellarii]|jgi:dihydropyrimidine dehydrogenase (NAD+) subunit PreA|uniref:Dihydroorotate dehydrogenase B (NAD(+)), catalytic subunit n=1 Tax=Clostridium luticellarii TaxID=1691940 RepID=A0A2T0BSD2_9CLOT|nr:NAD-dependent dihydropyrimidine dehydrogenase subunit PreA [Clostridium luticellarii]MCI1944743.1 NAD-dependent dihydropyrimidine dehydrogenase subunit PreA [Clostridium luticellarii]MCI1968240.1 NAD-dependent dihydropyrimidine dehydrogenase subunit PreA [Clostridium luticellarii]MCI1995215.1 NAD-dependent dihydropyrimidine dehydrogenase subunit PreA [Clostridium luticellarii]MCI2041250.1 NAD-dependent dihydropyrimidine dehydrogenase subunit PreA [Clostridium luticellarii]PRR86769.1 NAD-dep
MKDISIEFCNLKCENPFFLSSSVVGSNYEMCSKALDMGWGGIVFKTVGFYVSNEVSPRFDVISKENTPFVGFKNLEQISEHSLEENLDCMMRLKKKYKDKIIVASIMGQTEKEWTELAKLVTDVGCDMIECNFSCPQMAAHNMGSDVGQNPELVKKYCRAVKSGSDLPLLAKMTPNITDIVLPAEASIRGGADGIAAINTIKSITGVDLEKFSPYPVIDGKSSVSGYSGKAIKPIALRFIYDIASSIEMKNIPISGMGGIETWKDAAEFILMGASNIQITTAVMQYGYRIIDDLRDGLFNYMQEKGFKELKDMVGIAVDNVVPADQLDRSYIIYPEFENYNCVGCGRCYISCHDGGHQAIKWDYKNRKPILLKEKCVGCHLCLNICPVNDIVYGEKVYKNINSDFHRNYIEKFV